MWLLEIKIMCVACVIFLLDSIAQHIVSHLAFFPHVEIVPSQYIWNYLILSNGLIIYNCIIYN